MQVAALARDVLAGDAGQRRERAGARGDRARPWRASAFASRRSSSIAPATSMGTAASAACVGVEELRRQAKALARHGRGAVTARARALAALARVPGEHVARQRRDLHQALRELARARLRRVARGALGDR